MSKLQSIYEYFKNYTKEQIDEKLITIRYGKDLNNPVSSKLTNKQTNKFYGTLLPKMKKLLEYPDKEYKSRRRKEQVISTIPVAEVLDSNNIEQTTIVSGNSETHSLNEEKENVQSNVVASTTPSISEESVLNMKKKWQEKII